MCLLQRELFLLSLPVLLAGVQMQRLLSCVYCSMLESSVMTPRRSLFISHVYDHPPLPSELVVLIYIAVLLAYQLYSCLDKLWVLRSVAIRDVSGNKQGSSRTIATSLVEKPDDLNGLSPRYLCLCMADCHPFHVSYPPPTLPNPPLSITLLSQTQTPQPHLNTS